MPTDTITIIIAMTFIDRDFLWWIFLEWKNWKQKPLWHPLDHAQLLYQQHCPNRTDYYWLLVGQMGYPEFKYRYETNYWLNWLDLKEFPLICHGDLFLIVKYYFVCGEQLFPNINKMFSFWRISEEVKD